MEYLFFRMENEFGWKNREFQKSEVNLIEAKQRETTFGSKNQEFQKVIH